MRVFHSCIAAFRHSERNSASDLLARWRATGNCRFEGIFLSVSHRSLKTILGVDFSFPRYVVNEGNRDSQPLLAGCLERHAPP